MRMELGYKWENHSHYCKKEYFLGISCKQMPHSYRRYHRTVVLISTLTASGAARDLRGNRSSLMLFSFSFCPLSTRLLNLTYTHSHRPRQTATVYMDTLTNGWHYRWAWVARIWCIFKQCNVSPRGWATLSTRVQDKAFTSLFLILISHKENGWVQTQE